MNRHSINKTSFYVTILIFFISNQIYADNYSVKKSGKINIKCECLSIDSSCIPPKDLFAGINKYSTHSWHQIFITRTITELDLTQLCYNKRDDDKFGEGNCCELNNEKDIEKYFKGSIYAD